MRGRGDVLGIAVCVAGVCGVGGGMRGWRDGHCNGRYASYWNAFLLLNLSRSCSILKEINPKTFFRNFVVVKSKS